VADTSHNRPDEPRIKPDSTSLLKVHLTLRTYTYLLPTSEDRTRRAIDKAFGEDQAADHGPGADGLETA
jgi:hypothetical protein